MDRYCTVRLPTPRNQSSRSRTTWHEALCDTKHSKTATNSHHLFPYMAHHPHTPKYIKTTPHTLSHTNPIVTTILFFPNPPPEANSHQTTHRSIQWLKNNTQLLARPPDILFLNNPFPVRIKSTCQGCGVNTTRLFCFLSNQKRLDGSTVDACSGCNTSLHTINHITEDCTANNHTRQLHNIYSMKALWENPIQSNISLRCSTVLVAVQWQLFSYTNYFGVSSFTCSPCSPSSE